MNVDIPQVREDYFDSDALIVGQHPNDLKSRVALTLALLADFSYTENDDCDRSRVFRRDPKELAFYYNQGLVSNRQTPHELAEHLQTTFPRAGRRLMDVFNFTIAHKPHPDARLQKSRFLHEGCMGMKYPFQLLWHTDFVPEENMVRVLLRLGANNLQTAIALGEFPDVETSSLYGGRDYTGFFDESEHDISRFNNGDIAQLHANSVHSLWITNPQFYSEFLFVQDWQLPS